MNKPSERRDTATISPGGQPLTQAAPPASVADDLTLRRIGEALKGLRFGSVLTIVQDGVVVQIERTEKTRFTR